MIGCADLAGSAPKAARLLTALAVITAATAPVSAESSRLLLADPRIPVAEAWEQQRFGEATEYRNVTLGGAAYIRAIGRNSASGLYRHVGYDVFEHPWLEWRWRVDRLQRTADIRAKETEDFAAAIFLLFGDPGLLGRQVRTLAYVWTNDKLPEGGIVFSPHDPEAIRSVVVENGAGRIGQTHVERHNVVADYRRAFGEDPPRQLEILALWTDNDQTREPVEAYYGPVTARSD